LRGFKCGHEYARSEGMGVQRENSYRSTGAEHENDGNRTKELLYEEEVGKSKDPE